MTAATGPEASADATRQADALLTIARLGVATLADEINSSSAEVETVLQDLTWADVEQAGDAGLHIRILVTDGMTGQLVAERTGAGPWVLEIQGSFDQTLGREELALLEAACSERRSADAFSLLRQGAESACKIFASWENRPSETGFQWIRRRDRLVELLSVPSSALALARRLAEWPTCWRLIVADVTDTLVVTDGLVVGGSSQEPARAVGDWLDEDATAYAEVFQVAWGASRLPSPLAFVPHGPLSQDRDLSCRFRDLAALLCWAWLSSSPERLSFEGLRTVEFPLGVPEHYDLDGTIMLWRWAVSSTSMVRREALHRAITLSVRDPDDLSQVHSILKNARWFLELAERDAVAEALATRRQVRDAALKRAAETAARASDAAGKAFDRVILQIAAAVGIIVAQYKALLDPTAAARLLGGVLGVLLVSAFASLWFDFRYIAQGLARFREDLKSYRETLSEQDIDAIAGLKSLSVVDAQNSTRWKAALVLHGAACLVVVAVIGLLLQGDLRRLFP